MIDRERLDILLRDAEAEWRAELSRPGNSPVQNSVENFLTKLPPDDFDVLIDEALVKSDFQLGSALLRAIVDLAQRGKLSVGPAKSRFEPLLAMVQRQVEEMLNVAQAARGK